MCVEQGLGAHRKGGSAKAGLKPALSPGPTMATILSFKAADRGTTSQLGRVPAGCEIVLFPGVRYEYQAAPREEEAAKSKRKAPRQRDKLVLKD